MIPSLLLREGARLLAASGVEGGSREARWLWEIAPEPARFRACLARRAAREPLQYIEGTAEFLGRAFRVTPDVLVPRPETELLVRRALAFLTASAGGARALDLGTGSGAIAVSAAAEAPGSAWIASDLSAGALAVARDNAARHAVSGAVRFVQGDLAAPFADALFDCVVANPPYVASTEIPSLAPEIRDWEPRLALDGGPDGLDFYRRIGREVPRVLCPGGRLLVEVGAVQSAEVGRILRETGWVLLGVVRDDAGIERVIEAEVPSP